MQQIININGFEIDLTRLRERIQIGIKESERFIVKESKRRADLRPEAVQQHLDFCIKHKARLEEALKSEQGLVRFAESSFS